MCQIFQVFILFLFVFSQLLLYGCCLVILLVFLVGVLVVAFAVTVASCWQCCRCRHCRPRRHCCPGRHCDFLRGRVVVMGLPVLVVLLLLLDMHRYIVCSISTSMRQQGFFRLH